MKKRDDFKRFIVYCLASIVVIAQTAVFAYIWYDFYRGLIFEPFWRKGNWVLIAIYGLISFMFSKFYGGLRVGYLKKIDVFYSMTLATICTNIITYLQITLINRWFLDPWPMVEMTLVQIVIIIVWVWGSRFIYSRLYGARKLLVIYGDRDPGDLIQKMNSRSDKYNVSGKVHVDKGEKAIHQMMRDYEGVIIWDLPSNIRNRYLKYCFAHSIRCYMSPKISDVILMGSERIHLFDTPLLVSKNMGLSIEQRAMKRVLDIVVSGIGIVVSSPIMLIIALFVKLYDGGPVLYRQDRLTLGGKEFRICKFRSMCVDSEKNGARLASKNDSRITPVGRVLRNLHLDELPQLFNIFDLKWDEEICGLFGIDPVNMAEVTDSDACFGETDFEGLLPHKIPIHGVLGDSHGSLFGQGCLQPGMIKSTYGTGSSIMMNIGEKPILSTHGVVTSLAWKIGGKVNYVLEGNLNYTGAVITWLKDGLQIISSPGETGKLAKEAIQEDSLYLVPAFSGLGAPYWDSEARASVVGMSRTTRKAEFVRAALECIAYQITDVVQAMSEDAGVPVKELRVRPETTI